MTFHGDTIERPGIDAQDLGNPRFHKLFGTRYAYYAGSMYKGIASADLVVALGKAGFLGFLGTGGMSREAVEESLGRISTELAQGQPYGANLLHAFGHPEVEDALISCFLSHGVKVIEASAFMSMTPALVRYRCAGLSRGGDGQIREDTQIIAKISRPEVARVFMSPPPAKITDQLVSVGAITAEAAQIASRLPVASALCVESDSGGHTDQGASFSQFPSIQSLNRRTATEHGYGEAPLLGMAGGIGSPQAVAAAFMMGADFVVTGSINQCTVEAGTSDEVKTMLQGLDIQDTEYAPSGDMFELGARVQVMKKGSFFAARANKLFDLYQRLSGLDELDPDMRRQIEEKYFQRSIADVWEETEAFWRRTAPDVLARAEQSPKAKMGLIFRWYFIHTTRMALQGDPARRVDFQVHCGPAIGSFNQIVRGTDTEDWRNRRVADIADMLMQGAAELTANYFGKYRTLA